LNTVVRVNTSPEEPASDTPHQADARAGDELPIICPPLAGVELGNMRLNHQPQRLRPPEMIGHDSSLL